MANKTKVLFVSQEIFPFLPESPTASQARFLPQAVHESGKETRIFMPRYGKINERRHQLHEVIRLSGMNLIIDDTDHPLIIKVASIPQIRLQVYFIDNQEFFHRKAFFHDENEQLFTDNDMRMIFFTKGVLETVKKLGWTPDIIHCHGWFTSLMPLYIKKLYSRDPYFSDTKVVTSFFNDQFTGSLDPTLTKKILFDQIQDESLELAKDPTHFNLAKLAARHSDGVVFAEQGVHTGIQEFCAEMGLPSMSIEGELNTLDAMDELYDSIAMAKEELAL